MNPLDISDSCHPKAPFVWVQSIDLTTKNVSTTDFDGRPNCWNLQNVTKKNWNIIYKINKSSINKTGTSFFFEPKQHRKYMFPLTVGFWTLRHHFHMGFPKPNLSRVDEFFQAPIGTRAQTPPAWSGFPSNQSLVGWSAGYMYISISTLIHYITIHQDGKKKNIWLVISNPPKNIRVSWDYYS